MPSLKYFSQLPPRSFSICADEVPKRGNPGHAAFVGHRLDQRIGFSADVVVDRLADGVRESSGALFVVGQLDAASAGGM